MKTALDILLIMIAVALICFSLTGCGSGLSQSSLWSLRCRNLLNDTNGTGRTAEQIKICTDTLGPYPHE